MPFAPSPVKGFADMTGLESLQALLAQGKPPSMSETLNFYLAEVSEGRAVFTGTPTDRFLNPMGSVHGGWAATLLDSCMGCAVHSALPAGSGYTTLEFKIDLLRPITPQTGEVVAEGTLVRLGRRAAVAEGAIRDARGRVLARGTTTCLVFPLDDTADG